MPHNAVLDMALTLFYAALSLAATTHIVFNKRQPLSALIWIIIVWTAPFAGFFIYWYLGHNRIIENARKARGSEIQVGHAGIDALDRLGRSLTGLTLHRRCRVELLENGAEAYPAMLDSIFRAHDRIDLLTYIFDLDAVGKSFVQALAQAVGRGVKVRVLVDGIGAWAPGSRLRASLKAAGVEFSSFWRSDHLFHQPLINLRNHRKLLIVDGREAYTGGLNISERHHKGPLAIHPLMALRRVKSENRDLHFKIRGPVLPDMVAAFERDWHDQGARMTTPRRPTHGRHGRDLVRVLNSGPDQSFERIYEMLLGALRLAKKTVDLCTPYFIPDLPLLSCLRSLALSGVRVRLFVPRHSDHAFMAWASRAYFRELLEAGVQIWELEGSFVHTKACVIDEHWCMIGSCNLDPRSFRLNFEMNLEVRSRKLASQIGAVIRHYLRTSQSVDLAFLKRQGFWVRLRNNVVKLFSPYL